MPLQIKKDKLDILVFDDRESLGEAAATMISNKITELLSKKNDVNIIFAAAPSQNEFLHALVSDTTINWQKINAFHMDEYLGLRDGSPALFGSFLKSKIFAQVPFKSVNYINAGAPDIQKECDRYTELLTTNPPDIVCMGIGENTHIAFNDPHKADFNDPKSIKMVSLDLVCRQQQVNDGCFDTLKEVPGYALTLTIPALLKAPFIYCMVPGKTKAPAIWHTLTESVSEDYPSTILKTHNSAILFLDEDSYSNIKHNSL
jgi:glucosamine-6-phosphate deaminase